jgi:hypothetical protein
LNCSLEVAVIPDEDQLLLLFQYACFSIRAKMNLRDPGRIKIIRIVMTQRRGKGLVGNKR